MTTPRVDLHPASIKHIKKGHPWITSDRFSVKFPKNSFFISSKIDELNFVVMLNDPTHEQVKARVWRIEQKSNLDRKDFIYEMIGRLATSFDIREGQVFNRENFYLVFGEGDNLPGLFIQRLKDEVLVQFYADFWHHFEKDIVTFIAKRYPETTIWIQKRNKEQQKVFVCASTKSKKETSFELTEFGVKYNIKLNEYYDTGIYTDMSAIREKLIPEYKDKKILNLYCYTGAYSLCALKNEAKEVTSVDLSSKYLEWLEDNIKLNADLIDKKHTSINNSVQKALDDFIKKEEEFDLIICDPPSASSDGKKMSSAIDSYKELIPKLYKTLSKGGKAVVFLNTHSITRKSFEDKIRNYIGDLNFKVFGTLKLSEDCPSLKGFVEGDYLKGLILYKK